MKLKDIDEIIDDNEVSLSILRLSKDYSEEEYKVYLEKKISEIDRYISDINHLLELNIISKYKFSKYYPTALKKRRVAKDAYQSFLANKDEILKIVGFITRNRSYKLKTLTDELDSNKIKLTI